VSRIIILKTDAALSLPTTLSIAAGREFIARQAPELMPIEKLNYTITTKSPKEFRPPEPLLIANYSRLFQRQALPLDLYSLSF